MNRHIAATVFALLGLIQLAPPQTAEARDPHRRSTGVIVVYGSAYRVPLSRPTGDLLYFGGGHHNSWIALSVPYAIPYQVSPGIYSVSPLTSVYRMSPPLDPVDFAPRGPRDFLAPADPLSLPPPPLPRPEAIPVPPPLPTPLYEGPQEF